MDFEQWKKKLDQYLIAKCGLGVDDLGDAPYWDMWNDEVSISEAARTVLVEWNDMDDELATGLGID